MEVELKLAFDRAGAQAALGGHPLVAHFLQGRPRVGQVDNWYFDTPALTLWRRGVELRVRRQGGRYRQTVKWLPIATLEGRSPGGLHRLEEWEAGLAGDALDVAAIAAVLPPEAREVSNLLLEVSAAGELAPRVRTRYRRTTWLLRSANDDRVELAVDVGEVRADELALPLCEVELELKAGSERSLFELAAALQRDLPLRPELRGKAERGFRLLVAEPLAPRLAQAPRLDRSMPPAAALRALAEECLTHAQANEAGVVGTSSPEYVHQMRVGLRRLRAVLDLFGDIAPPPPLLAEIQWSAAMLGLARDAEVLAHETLARARAAKVMSEPSWSALQTAAVAAAAGARREAAAAVLSPRHVAWQLGLMTWVCGVAATVPEASAGEAPTRPRRQSPKAHAVADLEDFARARLRHLRRRLLQRGDELQRGDASIRHRARIAAKKLRYAAELLGPVCHGWRSRQRLRALGALQDGLGRLNDAEAAVVGLEQLAGEDATLVEAAACATRWLAADEERQVRRLGKLWRHAKHSL